MTQPAGTDVAKRIKALRLGATLYVACGVIWIVSAMIPVVMDRVRLGTWGEPNWVFLALGPVWLALAAVNIGQLKKAKAEAGGEAAR